MDILREDLFGWYICKKARHHLVLGIYDIIPTMYPSITSKVNKHLSKSFIKYFLYRTDFVWFPLSNTSRNMFGMSIVIYFILNIGFSDAFPSSMITWHTENPVYGLVDYSRNLFVDISFRFCWLFSLHSSLILLEKSINLSSVYILGFVFRSCSEWGPSWSWSWAYGSWIYNYLYNQYLSPLKFVRSNPGHGHVYLIQHYSLSVTCDRSVVFSGYSGFLHQQNWSPQYNWNIVESDIKHHNQNPCSECLIFLENILLILHKFKRD